VSAGAAGKAGEIKRRHGRRTPKEMDATTALQGRAMFTTNLTHYPVCQSLDRPAVPQLIYAARINAQDLIAAPAPDGFRDLGESGNILPDVEMVLPHLFFFGSEELGAAADVHDAEAIEAGEIAAVTSQLAKADGEFDLTKAILINDGLSGGLSKKSAVENHDGRVPQQTAGGQGAKQDCEASRPLLPPHVSP